MAVKSIDTIKSYLTGGKYPTASELADIIDTLVSIGQNSDGDTSGLAAVAISGDYNDLTNKPTIPTVPAISTNIASDATSNTKTASPKAVKDFVEGKGYLTQHQDISGKADQTDLEALEDRVDALEQSGSGGGNTNVVDSAISSTSEHALQNKVLYNELRITESSSSAVLTINGTNYPIVELDADTFPLQDWIDSYDTDNYVYIFPILDPNKAYIVHNTAETRELYSGAREFAFASEGTYIIKFDAPFYEGTTHDTVSITTSEDESQEEETKSVSSFPVNVNQWLSIPATDYFYTRTGEPYTENYQYDTSVKYYGLDSTVYDGYNVTEIPAIQNATETTGSTPTVKSLKQKIAELEARIEQISAQLQS